MKRILLKSIVLLALIVTQSCKQTTPTEENTEKTKETEHSMKTDENAVPDAHSSKISLDWAGIYQGITPCADCDGIKTKITLKSDENFERTTVYLGRSEEQFIEKGTFNWDDSNSKITLKLNENETQQYKVGENQLIHLDKAGKVIEGDLADKYRLIKNKTDAALEDKTWVLIELMGKTIDPKEEEMYLRFMSNEGLLTGSDGCNRFSGNYELLKGSRFRTGPLASTMKACLDMQYAGEYLQAIEKSDTYILVDSMLSITKARMAPMAKFKLKAD